MTDDVQTSTEPDERSVRAKAKRRSWICPGAGFALLGSSAWAILTLTTSLCNFPAWVWISFHPHAVALWTLLAVLGSSVILGLVEQIAVKKFKLQSPAPRFLTAGLMPLVFLFCVAAITSFAFFVTSYGSLQMGGTGMAPTIERGEQLVYYKRVEWQRVKPGEIVVYKNSDRSAWGQPGSLLISRILAGSGDTLSIENGNYVVNGTPGPKVASTGNYAPVIHVPIEPSAITVPDDSYFIIQDSPKGGFDSRVLSWIPKENIVTTRLWYLRPQRSILKAVK